RLNRETPKTVAMPVAAASIMPTSQVSTNNGQPDSSLAASEQATVEKAWADLGKSAPESPRAEVAIPATSDPLAAPAVVVQVQPPPTQQAYIPEEQTERYWKLRL